LAVEVSQLIEKGRKTNIMGNAAVVSADGKWLTSRSTEDQIEDFIEKEVSTYQVVVWSKSHCSHCTKAIATLEKRCDKVKVHKLDSHKLGEKVQLVLEQMTGLSSVPNIFINGKHIGGNKELQALKTSKQLKKLLKSSSEEGSQ
jgi:glutaredoxin 3